MNVKIKLALNSILLSSPTVAWKQMLEKVEESDENLSHLNRSGFHGCGWTESILLEDEDDRERSNNEDMQFGKKIKYFRSIKNE